MRQEEEDEEEEYVFDTPKMEHREGLGTLGTKLIRAGVGWVSTPCSIGAALPMRSGCVGVASSPFLRDEASVGGYGWNV